MAKRLSLPQLLRYWVDNLRLNEWRITAKLGTDEELEDNVALVQYCASTKQATIHLQRLDDIDRELEEDLVHELLHLVFLQTTYEISSLARHLQLPFEFALDVTAVALVKLRRKI